MEALQPAGIPLRIEVATSYIDGGQAIGWADPGRVVGCVAFCEPADAFDRFVLPYLEKSEPPERPVETLPPGVSELVAGLEAAHHRLYRENHSVLKDPKWVRLTAACADESRIYFVRTQAAWLYLLRGGKAHLLGEEDPKAAAADPRQYALGGPENLRLQVTSLGVVPEDEVLLVTGDATEAPDARAIARLFAESRDLKRAGDGVVNLLGLQGPSAAVVVFRFAPLLPGVREKHLDLMRGEAVLGELSTLARELVLGGREENVSLDSPGTTPAPSQITDAPESTEAMGAPAPDEGTCAPAPPEATGAAAPTASSQAGPSDHEHSPIVDGASSAGHRSTQAQSMKQAPSPDSGDDPFGQAPSPDSGDDPFGQAPSPDSGDPFGQAPSSDPGDAPSRVEAQNQTDASSQTAPAAHAASPAAHAASPAAHATASATPEQAQNGDSRPRADAFSFPSGSDMPRRKRGTAWPVIAVAIVLFALAALLLGGAGWPGLGKTIRGMLGLTDTSAARGVTEAHLTATSSPEGAVVAIDGIKLPGKTPLRGVRIAGGAHVVTMHLGAAGVWADTLKISGNETLQIHADFTGGLDITAEDLSGSPRAWLAGQTTKYSLPASIDSLPAGWYRVFFEDEKIPLWERKVLVRHGDRAEVRVNNAFASDKVLLRVESMRMFAAEGLRPVEGDSVFVDGAFAGLTPVELELSPELHGVDVVGAGETYSEILQVPAGASRFITPMFGLRERPQFDHLPPGEAVVQDGELLLAVQITALSGSHVRPRLHFPGSAAPSDGVPMVSVEPGENTFIARVKGDWLLPGTEMPYYFSVLTPEGEEVVSSLYRVILRADPQHMTAERTAS